MWMIFWLNQTTILSSRHSQTSHSAPVSQRRQKRTEPRHRGSAQKTSWRSVQPFQRYACRQTDTQTDRHQITLFPYRDWVTNVVCDNTVCDLNSSYFIEYWKVLNSVKNDKFPIILILTHDYYVLIFCQSVAWELVTEEKKSRRKLKFGTSGPHDNCKGP